MTVAIPCFRSSACVPVCLFILFVVGALIPGASADNLNSGRADKFYFFGAVDYSHQNLGDIKDAVDIQEDNFRDAGVPVSWDNFGNATGFQLEGGIFVSPSISLGLGMSGHWNNLSNQYSDYSGAYEEDMNLKTSQYSATVTYWPNGLAGWFMGSSAGIVKGSYESDVEFIYFSDFNQNFALDGKYKNNGTSVGLFFGYEKRLGTSGLLRSSLGYRFCNLGKFKGSTCNNWGDCLSGTARNQNGQPIEFDFSGLYLQVGFGFCGSSAN
jgi:hypothetical protein